MDMNEFMQRTTSAQEKTASMLERIADAMEKGSESVGAAARNMTGADKPSAGITEHNPLNAASNVGGFNPESDETQVIPRDVMLDALDKVAAKKEAASAAESHGVHGGEGATEQKGESPFKDTPNDVPAETKAEVKKVSADDARKALKAFAAREGNDAAMELLSDLGAASVSALVEKGQEALAELIRKCSEVTA